MKPKIDTRNPANIRAGGIRKAKAIEAKQDAFNARMLKRFEQPMNEWEIARLLHKL